MASVSIYLNFMGNAEEAMNAYKRIFKTEFSAPIFRMGDMPTDPNMPALLETEKKKIMHVALPIIGGTELMASDMLESMGHKLIEGNNVTINLSLDSQAQADELYAQLSEGGSENMKPQTMFWGYWGTCKDRFGIRWMFNVVAEH